jgi:hypothetical protein
MKVTPTKKYIISSIYLILAKAPGHYFRRLCIISNLSTKPAGPSSWGSSCFIIICWAIITRNFVPPYLGKSIQSQAHLIHLIVVSDKFPNLTKQIWKLLINLQRELRILSLLN